MNEFIELEVVYVKENEESGDSYSNVLKELNIQSNEDMMTKHCYVNKTELKENIFLITYFTENVEEYTVLEMFDNKQLVVKGNYKSLFKRIYDT
jgi:predicted RNA-binding protein associated with RNAse of E/G family